MQIFIYEYTCAAGVASHSLSAALQSEGWAMFRALLEDFGRLPGIETFTLLVEHCPYDYRYGVCRRVRSEEEETRFRELAAAADFTLLIAPEFDGILQQRCRWVIESGGRLLGPGPAAVGLTGDKFALSTYLRARGVPTPESRLFVLGEELPIALFPAVWKPRYGAGSQATFLVRSPQELPSCLEQAGLEGWRGDALLQPFVPGSPASVAFLTGPRCRIPLVPTAQRLSNDGRFHYLGGSLPLAGALAERAVALAKPAIDTIPDLQGYVGVDLVLGYAQDGSGDAVIEINPRPTTSYVGLRALAACNLAIALLHVALGKEMPILEWRSGMIQFDADGMIR
jgi:predicted ATP-grasp superfamily ATP-dependent carboligase